MPGIKKRSLDLAGHKTSISLEDEFWAALRQIALARGVSLNALVTEIDSQPRQGGLSSALRVFVLEAARAGEL